MATYEIPACLAYKTYVYVEAESEDEALRIFEEGDFDDMEGMEMVDWMVLEGKIKVIPE